MESLAAGGDGVARMPDGRALFVPFVAPGDRVRIEVVEERSRYARGVLAELLEPGPARVEPRCPVFGVCGGCTWQHVDYPAQLDAKASIVREALVRIAGLEALPELTLFASPQPYRYRGRARVLEDAGRVGFRRHRSNRICELNACPVLSESAEEALARLALDRAGSGEGATETSAGADRGASDSRPRDSAEWEIFSGDDGRTRSVPLDLDPAPEPAGGDGPPLALTVAGARLRVSPGVFAQSNFLLHDALYRAVEAAVGPGGGGFLLELYAGAGFFTLGLAARFERVVAVESHPLAVRDLAHNLAQAGHTQVEVVSQAVEEYLAGHPESGRADRDAALVPEVVLLDPPRTGLAPGAASDLLVLGAPRVVYLSCDPATLARDLALLCRGGYRLEGLCVLDLFPQTPHVETLASLGLEP